MSVTPACYAHVTRKLMNVAPGKVVAVLEVRSAYVFRTAKVRRRTFSGWLLLTELGGGCGVDVTSVIGRPVSVYRIVTTAVPEVNRAKFTLELFIKFRATC